MHVASRPIAAAPAAARSPRAAAPAVAAALSLGAAWVHLAYTASHFRQWWAYGAFFLAVGIGQALYAPLVLRWPRPAVAMLGIAGNVAIIGMYVLSRTAGPPLGPHAGVPEVAGTVDVATTAGEVVLVVILLSLLGGATRRRVANLLLAAGALLWALRLTGNLP